MAVGRWFGTALLFGRLVNSPVMNTATSSNSAASLVRAPIMLRKQVWLRSYPETPAATFQ